MVELQDKVGTYTGYLHSTDVGRLLPQLSIGVVFQQIGFVPDVIGVKMVNHNGKMTVVGASFASADCVLISINVDQLRAERISVSVKSDTVGKYLLHFINGESIDEGTLVNDLQTLENYMYGVH